MLAIISNLNLLRRQQRFGTQVVTPQELAELAVETKPAEFADGLLYEGQIVFEVDPKRLKNDGNPLGLGDGFGKVVGGVLDNKIDIDWAGETEAVEKKHLRAAPVVGTKFYWKQDTDKKQQYVIGAYNEAGDCVIWHTTPEEDTTQYAKPRRRRVRVRFACGGRSDVSWCTPEIAQKSVSKTNASKPASKKKSKKPVSKTSDAKNPAGKKKSKKPVSTKSVREKKHVVYNFHHPTSDENIKTCLTLPCNAYHAGINCVVRVLCEHPNDKTMFILEGLGTKSKCHIRELTEDETSLDAVTSETDTAEEQTKKTRKKSRKPTVEVKWKRCRAVSLSSMELATFNKVLQVLQSEEVLDSPPQEYEEFAHRVCREYKGLQNSPLHLNSKKIVKAAIAQVFAQIRGKSSVPHGGDNASALAMLLPVVEKVYNSDLSILTVISFAPPPQRLRLGHGRH